MKLHLKADSADGIHTKFTVFINKANCGQLCMLEKEALYFHDLVLRTRYKIEEDELTSSGRWFKEEN